MNAPPLPNHLPSTIEVESSSLNKLRKRSWWVLGIGAVVSLVPYVSLVMWALFLPVIIFAGYSARKLIKMNERKQGISLLIAAIIFVPYTFIASSVTTLVFAGAVEGVKRGVAEGTSKIGSTGDAIPADESKTSDAGSKSVRPDSKKTIEFWKKMREIEGQANNSLKDDPRKYPMAEGGQYDFPKFSNDDFEALTNFHFSQGAIKQQVSNDIGNLPILGIDPDLMRFKIDLCEHWRSTADVVNGLAVIFNAVHQQKVRFTSNEAYALRTAKALLKQGDMEAEYQENQQEIEGMRKKWSVVRDNDAMLREKISKREQEIKSVLTSRYNWEFN